MQGAGSEIGRNFILHRDLFFLYSSMNLTVNGERYETSGAPNLLQVLDSLKVHVQRGLAVALNHKVIPKSSLADTQVREGDAIEIIYPTAGG